MGIQVTHIRNHRESIHTLATAQFDLWGSLTSRNTLEEYERLLYRAAESENLPVTLVAVDESRVLGSVNVLECDLSLRQELTPWLAQLFVFPAFRRQGVGTSLVKAAFLAARELGWHVLYLYTSGTLPEFYERLGWARREEVEYLSKMRVIMCYTAC